MPNRKKPKVYITRRLPDAVASAREAEAQQRLQEIAESGEGVDEQLDLERKRRRKAERKLAMASNCC